jgi:hypothetical protein
MKLNKGFSIIELIIVVFSGLVIISALVFWVDPRDSMRNTRDARRIADLNNLYKVVILALNEGNIELNSECNDGADEYFRLLNCDTYVEPIESELTRISAIDGTGWVRFDIPTNGDGVAPYTNSLVLDPLSPKNDEQYDILDGTYRYIFVSNGTDFAFRTVLEANTDKMQEDGGFLDSYYEIGSNIGGYLY